MTITMNRKVLSKKLEASLTEEIEPLDTVQPFTHQKRGVEQRLIFGKLKQSQVDNALLARLREAQAWMSRLVDGTYTTLKEIAGETGTDLGNVSRNLRLAFLAPDIKEAIIEGTQPPSLTLESLKKAGPLPACWKEQRELLGF